MFLITAYHTRCSVHFTVEKSSTSGSSFSWCRSEHNVLHAQTHRIRTEQRSLLEAFSSRNVGKSSSQCFHGSLFLYQLLSRPSEVFNRCNRNWVQEPEQDEGRHQNDDTDLGSVQMYDSLRKHAFLMIFENHSKTHYLTTALQIVYLAASFADDLMMSLAVGTPTRLNVMPLGIQNMHFIRNLKASTSMLRYLLS